MDELYIDNLINDAIKQLADDNPNEGAEALQELAILFNKAGIGRESFNHIRKHIIEQAVERTSAYFIKIKLESFEHKLQESRNGTSKRIIVPTKH